jgi:hypothetical protein
MSSLFAHAAVGAALAGTGRRPWACRCATAAAALAPDLDYPLAWFAGVRFPIRYTHSLGFCLATGLVGAAFAVVLARSPETRGLVWRIPVAIGSHLVLDALVAVLPEPWFWPASPVTYKLPFGALPSAGALAPGNPYLYRNLALETAVLGPLLWLAFRGGSARPVWRVAAGAISAVFACFCAGLGRG